MCTPSKQEFVGNESKNTALPYFWYYDPLILSYLRMYASSLASGQVAAAVRPCFQPLSDAAKRDGIDAVARSSGLSGFQQNPFYFPLAKEKLPRISNQTPNPGDVKPLSENAPKFDDQSAPFFVDGDQPVEHISEQALNKLLTRYVSDPLGISVIRSRFVEYAQLMEQRLGSMMTQNRLLQQEIACLRNKQTVSIPNCSSVRSCVTKSCS
ncbi:unnamed protein product [Soboliphyme baturini]|uniref:Uncharacterized protein n=1 Tax=Soboliphyme baturini TaxID=241478 RepID=A0A183IJN2_9BILA|nr:unnamed protein product [Soboliphyme baturini]